MIPARLLLSTVARTLATGRIAVGTLVVPSFTWALTAKEGAPSLVMVFLWALAVVLYVHDLQFTFRDLLAVARTPKVPKVLKVQDPQFTDGRSWEDLAHAEFGWQVMNNQLLVRIRAMVKSVEYEIARTGIATHDHLRALEVLREYESQTESRLNRGH